MSDLPGGYTGEPGPSEWAEENRRVIGTWKRVLEVSDMTLRDYFAAAALTGLLADDQIRDKWEGFAKNVYQIADAMLKERAK